MAGLTCFFLFSIFLVNNVLSRPNPSSNPSPSPSSTTVVQMRSASLDPEYEKDVLKECARVRLEVEEVPEGKREEVLIKKYAMERVDHEKTKEDKNSAVKDKDTLNEDRFFVVTRQVIDNAEENFPQPQDSDWQTKGVKYDKTKLQGKVGWDLFQERRRQKWKYYLDNPPNDFMRELAKKVADKDTFADGVALAYRLLSDKFHKGFHLTIFKDPAQFFIYQRVVDALRILLEKEGILKIYVDQLKLTTPPK